MNIINVTRKTTLVKQGKMALNFWSRFRGLLFTNDFPCGQGILIKPCWSIHTIGMAYCIDILFIDGNDRILKVICGMKPYRFASCRGSAYVVEVPVGTVTHTGTQCGDKVMVGLQEITDDK